MTAWEIFRNFINSKEIGHIFKRQDLILFAKWKQINESTIERYRSLVQQAKFIERVGRGQYKLVDHLPENLTMGSLFDLLRGDNLSYVESIQKQKDFNVAKAKFTHERSEVLARLIEDLKPLIAYAEKIEGPAFGLKLLRRNCIWERSKTPNPSRKWLKEYQEVLNDKTPLE